MKIKKYLNPSGPLVKINGEWVPLVSDGARNLYAVDKLGKRKNFKINTKPKSATGNKEIVVTPKGNTIVDKKDLKPKPVGYKSAFQGNLIMTPVRKGFELLGKGLYAGTQALERGFTYGGLPNTFGMYSPERSKLLINAPTPGTDTTFKYVLPYTMPSRWVGWARTGYAPHREENTGLGDEDLNLMFDVASAPLVFKGIKSTPKTLNSGLEIASDLGSKTARNWRLAKEINQVTKSKPSIEVPNPTEYNISDNITLYRANPTNIKNPSYKGERYGDTSGLYVGKWFTDESSKPHWYASNMAKRGEEPAYYLVTVPKYWAEKQKASHKISNSNIEYEPEDYIIEDGILGLQGQLYQGRPGTIQYLQQSFKTPKLSEPLTSLKFFERRPSELTEAERSGIPKGERNFSPRWHVAKYPGYQLKGLMGGSPLERLLSKNGTISVNLLNAHFNKASQVEKEVVSKVLSEKFAGLRTIDYNLFKKAVLDELIGTYNRVPLTEWADYGMEGLGFETLITHDGNTIAYNEITGEFEQIAPFTPFKPNYTLNTFTFESPRIPYGNTKHYGGNPIGHSRTYTLPEDPHTLYVLESQSDWALSAVQKESIDPQSGYERASRAAAKRLQEIELMKANLEKGLDPDGHKIQHEGERRDVEEIIKHTERQLANNNARAARFDAILHPEKYILENHLKQNYLQRLLQENLRYASENGLTKMRYPTSETAAKIEGYPKESFLDPKIINRWRDLDKERMLLYNEQRELGIFDLKRDYINKRLKEIKQEQEYLATLVDYSPEHKTILKKYADFPKLFLKLFKDSKVRTVTDNKGNTWYEVDVPKGYLSREWKFKQGGKFSKLEFLKLMKHES